MSEIIAGEMDAIKAIIADEEQLRDEEWQLLKRLEDANRTAKEQIERQTARWGVMHDVCNRLRARLTTLEDIHADQIAIDPFQDE